MFNAIIMPIAKVLGYIFNLLFEALSFLHIGNVAVAIVLFTIIVKLCMLPLSIKQQKLTKLNAVMSPEIKAINAKYKDKRNDQNAMMKMQEETKAVYEKYGTSQMGGCVQLLIQFPILMALYRVIQDIPMYVGQLKNLFLAILTGTDGGIMCVSDYADKMGQISSSVDWSNVDAAVKAMNSFTADQWNQLKDLFPAFSQIIADNQTKITEMNTFLTVNVSQNPVFGLSVTMLIPILAGLSQYISVKVSQGRVEMDDDNPAAASMKMMTLFAPLMSVFIAFSVPTGLGVYWIATAVFQTVLQLIVNRHYDKIGVDAIIAKSVEKANKKRAKKGLPPQQIAKNATVNTKKVDNIEKNKQRIQNLQDKKDANDKKMKEIMESTKYYKSAKPGSLAEKAGMVSKYNDKNEKKK